MRNMPGQLDAQVLRPIEIHSLGDRHNVTAETACGEPEARFDRFVGESVSNQFRHETLPCGEWGEILFLGTHGAFPLSAALGGKSCRA